MSPTGMSGVFVDDELVPGDLGASPTIEDVLRAAGKDPARFDCYQQFTDGREDMPVPPGTVLDLTSEPEANFYIAIDEKVQQ